MASARLVQCLHGTAKLPIEVEAAGGRCSLCPHKAAKLPTKVVEATSSSGIV